MLTVLFEKMRTCKAEAKARVDRTVERVTKAFETQEPMPIGFAKMPDNGRVAVLAMPDGTIQLRLYGPPGFAGLGRVLESDEIALKVYYEDPKPIED